ncbi:MAG: hypothetical protein RLW62_13240, partial [Gammaproteobacteria bacterium]
MDRLIASLVGLLWTVIAAVLIAGTAAVALVRLALPELGGQRDALAAWVSEAFNRPVVIGDITAHWHGWTPRITARDITVLDRDGVERLVRFEHATIDIAPLDSLARGALAPQSLVLSGVALALVRHDDGRFSVAGMPPPKSPIVKWLIEQDNFAVTEAALEIFDERSQTRFALADLAVTVRNRDGRKHLAGQVTLPAALGGRLAFRVSARGSPLGDDWDGQIDFALRDVSSAFLLDRLDWQGPPPDAARLDLDGWTRWRDARLEQADLRLGARTDSAVPGAPRLLAARGELTRRAAGWRLDVGDVSLPTLDLGAAPGALSVAWRSHDGALVALAARAADIPLAPLAAFAGGLPKVPAALRATLAAARPAGRLARGELAWRGPRGNAAGYYLEAHLEDLGNHATAVLPALDALDASVRLTRTAGYARFTDASVTLEHPRLVGPLTVDALTGTLGWRHGADGRVAVFSPRLAATVNEVTLATVFSVADATGT